MFDDIFAQIKKLKRALLTVIASDRVYATRRLRKLCTDEDFILHNATKNPRKMMLRKLNLKADEWLKSPQLA